MESHRAERTPSIVPFAILFAASVIGLSTAGLRDSFAQEAAAVPGSAPAAEPPSVVEGAGPASESEGASATPEPKRKKKGTARGEVKEMEGTTAKERFEGNTILKSQYFLNGQSLEVDPD